MTNPFRHFNRTILKPLGILWDKVHNLDNMRGDEFIQIRRSGAGTTIGLNLAKARERIAKKTQASSISTIYVVTGQHTTKYGFYHCLPLLINSDTVNAGYSTAGVKMKNNNLAIGPLDLGVPGSRFPDSWDISTFYTEGGLVSIGRQIFKALANNLKKDPLTESEDWDEITVEVLNLSEWMGWDGSADAEPPKNEEFGAEITELLPKLVYLDTVIASRQPTSDGGSVIAGFDNMGPTRLFRLEKAISQTNTQQFTGIAIKSDGHRTIPGEGLYEVKLIPYTDAEEDNGGSSLNQFWCGEGTLDRRVLLCTWVKGMWYWIPSVQKNIGSNEDVFNEFNGLYCGRIIGTGLRAGGTSGRTDIEVAVDEGLGMEIISDLLAVKVDDTTIGFNGSGQIEDKSP